MITLFKEDFVGEYKIAQNQYTDVSAFITASKIDQHIRDVIGYELGNLFIADDTAQRFQDIKFGFHFNPYTCVGLTEIVKALAYCEIASFQKNVATISGNAVVDTDGTSAQQMYVVKVYNRTCREIEHLRYYLMINSTIYPEFKVYKHFELNFF